VWVKENFMVSVDLERLKFLGFGKDYSLSQERWKPTLKPGE